MAPSLCAPAAGTPETFDFLLAYSLAYATAFEWPAAWGSVGDVRDDIDFDAEVAPVVFGQFMNPSNFGLFEFVRLVMHEPLDTFYPNYLLYIMSFATAARGELESRAGGPVAQNLDHVYELTADEKSYLAGLGVDAETLLAEMNANRIAARPAPRNYVKHYAKFTGRIRRPVLTVHTRIDALVLAEHQSAYRETVEAAGREDLLMQVFVDRVGHCNLTPEQDVLAVEAMRYWLETGQAPQAPDSTFFPASEGFLPGFSPWPWPF